MDDTLINIRIFAIHFGIRRNWIPYISLNRYHSDKKYPDGLFSVYRWFSWTPKAKTY